MNRYGGLVVRLLGGNDHGGTSYARAMESLTPIRYRPLGSQRRNCYRLKITEQNMNIIRMAIMFLITKKDTLYAIYRGEHADLFCDFFYRHPEEYESDEHWTEMIAAAHAWIGNGKLLVERWTSKKQRKDVAVDLLFARLNDAGAKEYFNLVEDEVEEAPDPKAVCLWESEEAMSLLFDWECPLMESLANLEGEDESFSDAGWSSSGKSNGSSADDGEEDEEDEDEVDGASDQEDIDEWTSDISGH